MHLKTAKLKEIKPYDRNPRINESAVEAVAESIRQCSYIAPIIVDEDGVILAGHTRYKALKMLGYTECEIIVKEGLTEEQKRKYRILDNKTNELAEWDLELLTIELDGLDFDGFDFGFDEEEEESESEIIEDEAPEVDEESDPVAKLGDIWQLGRHRLMCGDSTDRETVERLMDGNKADMVFTDPPYGYEYQSNKRTKTQKFDVLENDDKILDFFPNLSGRVNGFVMICTTWKVLDKWLPLFKRYFDLTNMIVWDKGGGGMGDLSHTFSTDYEVILCASNGAEIQEKRIGSVWSIGKDNASDYAHPTQKPVELSSMAIRHTTKSAAIVLDVFGGSGSTLLACEQLGRTCYMMELDPKYIDVIIKRWENFTGETAVLLNG